MSDEDALGPAPAPCAGEVHDGTRCEDLGFTRVCSGDYFVHAGESC